MIRRHPSAVISLVLFFLFLFFGCGMKHAPQGREEFYRETMRLEKLIAEQADPSARAKLHLQLAELFIDSRNPEMNYGKALPEFEAYLTLAPVEARKDEARNWVAILREWERAEKETVLLRGKMENLVGENKEKGEALDRQVKLLDLEGKKNEELKASLGKIQVRLEGLEKANRTLSEANRSLRESNEQMKETLEKLKKLDLQMEEKRRTIK